ncbi:MAG: DUF6554 family protein [Prochlorococcaceae cyanobacterium]
MGAVTASLGLAAGLSASTAWADNSPATAGGKGAQVYCFMRAAGNNHDVSWAAAYSLIKRQSASLFKTSPEHAAVMITEAVVQNPNTYPDCGRYLGDIYSRAATPAKAAENGATAPAPTQAPASGTSRSDRYAY